MRDFTHLAGCQHGRATRQFRQCEIGPGNEAQHGHGNGQPADRSLALQYTRRLGEQRIPIITARVAIIEFMGCLVVIARGEPGGDRGGKIIDVEQRKPTASVARNQRPASAHTAKQRQHLAIARPVYRGWSQDRPGQPASVVGKGAFAAPLAAGVIRQLRLARRQ